MPALAASDREIMPELLAAMRDSEYPPELIYAYKKTGYIVLSDFWGQTLPEGAEEMWNAAVMEYFQLECEAGARRPD